MNTPISFRLRKDVDSDLINAVENLERHELKNLCRDGLRLMLGIRTTKLTAVLEQPLDIPVITHKQSTSLTEEKSPLGRPVPGKPAVFFPTKRG